MNIKVKSHRQINTNRGSSELVLNFSGKQINHIIVNSIKRIIQSDIPIYAYNSFTITQNDSVFNNNYLKTHIKNIPVWGIDNNLEEFIEKKEEDEEEVFDEETGLIQDDIDLTNNKETNYSSLNKLTMYLDFENKKNEIVHVTSDDCIFYYKEGMIKTPYNNKIQILKLQPNQKIKLSVQANPGTMDTHAIFSATSVCFFNENNESDYDFTIESRGQLSEVRIIQLGIKLIIKKLEKFLQNLPKNKGMEGILKVENEDHLLGNLLTHQMQQMKSVRFCAYTTPHPLNKEIEIDYKLNSGNINIIFKEVVAYYEVLFLNIEKEILKIK